MVIMLLKVVVFMAEFWDIYNKQGKKKNKVIRKGQPLLNGEYHLIVEGWIRCGEDTFLIQKRSANKKLFPNMWYCSLGGSVQAGEDAKQGLIREAKEELGIDISNDLIKLKRIITENYCIFYIYLIERDIDLKEIVLQKEEVADVKIATKSEICDLIKNNEMIYLDYYQKFFENIEKVPYLR